MKLILYLSIVSCCIKAAFCGGISLRDISHTHDFFDKILNIFLSGNFLTKIQNKKVDEFSEKLYNRRAWASYDMKRNGIHITKKDNYISATIDGEHNEAVMDMFFKMSRNFICHEINSIIFKNIIWDFSNTFVLRNIFSMLKFNLENITILNCSWKFSDTLRFYLCGYGLPIFKQNKQIILKDGISKLNLHRCLTYLIMS